ncbi:MAG: TolC family protein [Bacteroidales bacterium]|nr:TolC family protein [Bacteroidales bacterium]
MKTLSLIIVFSFLFIWQSQTFAQEPWNLEKCINYAIENNIQVKQMQLQARSSEYNLQESKAGLAPSLNANVNDAFQFGYTIDPYTNQFTNQNVQSLSASITGSVTLFNGLQQVNTVKKNRYTLMSDLQAVEDVRYSITMQVASSYLQILFDKELLDVANGQLEITKTQVQRTRILVEAGSLAKGNLLEIQAQLAGEELTKINAENNLKSSYLNLTQLLELDTTSAFAIQVPELDDPSSEILLDSVSTIFANSQGLPMIKKEEFKLQSSEQNLNIAKGGMSPRFYLQGSYGSGYSSARTYPNGDIYPYSDQFVDNRSLSVSIGVSIPIFNNFSVKNRISQSKLGIENSKYQLDLAKNQLFKDIQSARNSAEAALAKFNASKKAVEAQQESFSYTQQKFDLGLVNSVDYNTAKNQLAKSQSDMVQAKFEFIFRINILNFYQGIPFKL